MHHDDFTKAERRQLRSLAALAYERELNVYLEQLHTAFASWRTHEIDAFELSDRIHKFHNGDARELWKVYENAPAFLSVSAALSRGILQESEIPEILLSKLPRAAV